MIPERCVSCAECSFSQPDPSANRPTPTRLNATQPLHRHGAQRRALQHLPASARPPLGCGCSGPAPCPRACACAPRTDCLSAWCTDGTRCPLGYGITAKFASKCTICYSPVKPGVDQITKLNCGWAHMSCAAEFTFNSAVDIDSALARVNGIALDQQQATLFTSLIGCREHTIVSAVPGAGKSSNLARLAQVTGQAMTKALTYNRLSARRARPRCAPCALPTRARGAARTTKQRRLRRRPHAHMHMHMPHAHATCTCHMHMHIHMHSCLAPRHA